MAARATLATPVTASVSNVVGGYCRCRRAAADAALLHATRRGQLPEVPSRGGNLVADLPSRLLSWTPLLPAYIGGDRGFMIGRCACRIAREQERLRLR